MSSRSTHQFVNGVRVYDEHQLPLAHARAS